MDLFVRVFRGMGVAAFILGGRDSGGRGHLDRHRRECRRSADRRPGQPAGRGQHDPVLFPPRTRASGSTTSKSTMPIRRLIATGLFQDVQIRRAGPQIIVTVVESPVINRVAFEGNKRVKDEILTGEVQSKPRGTFSRADRPVGRAAHPRSLSGARALRHPGRAQDHRTAQQPRRPGVRNLRGAENHGPAPRVRRQSRVLGRAAARRDPHRRDRNSQLPQEQRPLRPGPDRRRSRTPAPLLSEERLCRHPHRLVGRRIRSGSARLRRHVPDRGGRPQSIRRGRRAVEHPRRRSLCAPRPAADAIRAGCTTPSWWKRRSRT